jgi:hypothetical protein
MLLHTEEYIKIILLLSNSNRRINLEFINLDRINPYCRYQERTYLDCILWSRFICPEPYSLDLYDPHLSGPDMYVPDMYSPGLYGLDL